MYRRSDGKWVAQVDAGRDPVTGARRRLRRVRSSRAAAHRALTDLRREVGTPAAVENVTVARWCDVWLADCGDRVRAGELAPRTVVGYDSDVRRHIVPHLGTVRLDKLAPGHVRRMMTAIQAAGWKPRTAGAARGTLSAALSAAVADGLIVVNVAKATPPPPRPTPDPSAFSDAELEAIAAAAREDRLGAMWVFAVLTGLRTSELCALRWDDVDLDAGTYQVSEGLHRIGPTGAKVVGDRGLVTAKPKSRRSGEPTPMSPAAVDVLRRHRAAQAAERLAASSWHDSGRVFTSTSGTTLDPDNARKRWRALLEAAGVAATRPSGAGRGLHELRRTFATRLRDQGVALEDVQRLGRWSSPTTLLRFYAAVDDERLRRAAGQSGDGIVW